jgi:hypothetical protein
MKYSSLNGVIIAENLCSKIEIYCGYSILGSDEKGRSFEQILTLCPDLQEKWTRYFED